MSVFDLNINSSKIKRKKYNLLVNNSQGLLYKLWQPGGKETQLQVSYNEDEEDDVGNTDILYEFD